MMIILHILKYKFLSFIKINISLSASSLIKNVGSFIVYSAFAVGAFFFSYSLVKYALEELRIGLFLLHEFFSITLFIFFIAVNIGNIIVSYSTLYKSQEVNYLFSKPIKPASIFIIKFFDNFFYSSSTLILILLSVLGGYAYYLQLSFANVVLVFLFNFVPFMLTAAALGIIVLLVIVKLSTIIGTRIVLFNLVALYLLSLALFFGVTSPVDLVKEVMKYYPNVDLYFGNLLPAELKYLPNHWLSESLYWIARDKFIAAGKYFYLQIITSIVLLIFALYLGTKWYHKTWFYSFKLRNNKSKPDIERMLSFNSESKLSKSVEAIVKREFHLFMREPTQIFHITILFLLITIFITSVSNVIYLGGLNIFMQTVIYLSVFIFNNFMVATLSLRFVFPLYSLEGNSFWKIKSAPISTLRFMSIKITPYIATILLVSLVLSIAVNRLFNFDLLVLMTIANFIITFAIVSINFSMGSLFAVFTEKNPIRLASSQGASLSFLLNLIYIILLVLLFYFPLNKYFETLINSTDGDLTYIYFAIGILVISTGIIIAVSALIVIKNLKKDF